MGGAPVTYEVNLVPDASIAAEFDVWLEEHVEDMLRLPGFVRATVRRAEDGDYAVRSVAYVLSDRAALDAYLEEHAPRMRQAGIDRFGDRFTASRRILDQGYELTPPGPPTDACANCGEGLVGQYCANCGQRARTRMISLWELVREASDILTSLDSRLWRTLGFLMFRPGFLTEDYLLGRRARYIPPLRLFIGCSLLFFFLLAIGARYGLDGSVVVDGGEDPGVNLQLDLGDDDDSEQPAPDRVDSDDAGVSRQLAVVGDDTATTPASAAGRTSGPGGAEETGTPADSGDGAATGSEPGGEQGSGDNGDECEDINVDIPESWGWLRTWLTEERLKATCRKVTADGGRGFGSALLENIPIMMFVLLPVMAFFMKLTYPLSHRYYVEHLLFLVHFHAFFYLLLTINLWAEWGFEGTALPDWPSYALGIVTAIYVPVYLYKAMRLVYKQGHVATLSKYVLLGFAYLAGFTVLFAGTLAVTALTL